MLLGLALVLLIIGLFTTAKFLILVALVVALFGLFYPV